MKSRLRFTRRGKPAVVNELTTSREESGARSDYPEARRKKTIVNRRTSEYRALISSCLGKRPEVERRVESSSTSEAASRLLGRAKRPLGDEGDACYRRDARKPSGELRDSRAMRKVLAEASEQSSSG